MLRRALTALGLAVTVPFIGGCGTAVNTLWLIPEEGGKRPYGGVRVDWGVIRNPPAHPLPSDHFERAVLALDLPFSLVGDTLALPYILAYDAGLFGKRCMNLGGDAHGETVRKLRESGGGTSAPVDQSDQFLMAPDVIRCSGLQRFGHRSNLP